MEGKTLWKLSWVSVSPCMVTITFAPLTEEGFMTCQKEQDIT